MRLQRVHSIKLDSKRTQCWATCCSKHIVLCMVGPISNEAHHYWQWPVILHNISHLLITAHGAKVLLFQPQPMKYNRSIWTRYPVAQGSTRSARTKPSRSPQGHLRWSVTFAKRQLGTSECQHSLWQEHFESWWSVEFAPSLLQLTYTPSMFYKFLPHELHTKMLYGYMHPDMKLI